LMDYYEKLANQKIKSYNLVLKSATKVEPYFAEVYERFPEEPEGAAPAAAPALKVGDVRKGFEYIGGNPSAQSSWKKVTK